MCIRDSYGRYPNFKGNIRNEGLNDVSDKYKNKHCLFFVPTHDKYNTYHQDEIGVIKYNTRNSDGNNKMMTIQSSNTLLIGSGKNHGNLTPPDNIEGTEF